MYIDIILVFLILSSLLMILSALKIKEAFCSKEDVTIKYGDIEKCFQKGKYINTTQMFPDKKKCVIDPGFNNVDIYADSDFNTHLYTLKPEQNTDVMCKPGSIKVY